MVALGEGAVSYERGTPVDAGGSAGGVPGGRVESLVSLSLSFSLSLSLFLSRSLALWRALPPGAWRARSKMALTL